MFPALRSEGQKQRGFTNRGGGIFCGNASSATITNCIIENSTAGDSVAQGHNGGGIYCSGGSPTIEYCTIRNNAAQSGGGIYLSYSSAIIRDCVIQDNTTSSPDFFNYGGGINASGGSVTLQGTLITRNSARQGGGIYLTSDPFTMDACTITDNYATAYGGGLRYSGGCSPVITNSVIAGNEAEIEGGGLYGSGGDAPIVTNCTLFNNIAGDAGGAVYGYYSSPVITNSVLWHNISNGGWLYPISYEGYGYSPVVTYSDVQGGYSGEGNMDAYPYFQNTSGADPNNWDLRLQCDSPCIDAGNNAAPEIPVDDFDGGVRIFDCNGGAVPVVDMGAFELHFHRSRLGSGGVTPDSGDPNTLFRFSVDYLHPDGLEPIEKSVVINGTAYPMDLLAGSPYDGTYVHEAHLPIGTTYYFLFQDANGCSARLPAEGTLDGPVVTNQCPSLSLNQVSPAAGGTTTLFRITVDYVDADSTPPAAAMVVINNEWRAMALLNGTADNGTYYLDTLMEPNSVYYFRFDDGFGCPVRLPETGTFEGPAVSGMTHVVPDDFPDIATAVSGSNGHDVIIVRDGVYTGDNNRNIDFGGKPLTVRSENGPLHTMIDCGGSGRAFYLADTASSGSVIEGFTITNGSTTGSGGGIYSEAIVTIRNCRIIENSAHNGGGIFLGYQTAGSAIVNCLIFGNTANTASGHGGGIFLGTMFHPALPVSITHCSVVNNTAYWGGGVGHLNLNDFYCNMDISNTILRGNSATYGPQLATSGWIFGSLDYSDVEGGEADIHGGAPWGDGNIDEPPGFVDTTPASYLDWDLHLQAASPCIDAGTNDAPLMPDTDIDGRDRVLDGDEDGTAIADMGACEFAPPLKGDFDTDCDVDGIDLAAYDMNSAGISLDDFALNFGRTGCP